MRRLDLEAVLVGRVGDDRVPLERLDIDVAAGESHPEGEIDDERVAVHCPVLPAKLEVLDPNQVLNRLDVFGQRPLGPSAIPPVPHERVRLLVAHEIGGLVTQSDRPKVLELDVLVLGHKLLHRVGRERGVLPSARLHDVCDRTDALLA